jgi:8-oxo-dGTP diphosphatase
LSVVRAAGGLVVRNGDVLLVHRPRYNDWTFPKGKAKAGESDEECSLREVEEETGLRCRLLEQAGTTEYTDSKGRPKRVRWWLMEPVRGEFTAGDEVDVVRWAPPGDTAALLSYSRDVPLLEHIAWP